MVDAPGQNDPPAPVTTAEGPAQISSVTEHAAMKDPSVAVNVMMLSPRAGGVQSRAPVAGFPVPAANVAPAGRPRLLRRTTSLKFGSFADTTKVNGWSTA